MPKTKEKTEVTKIEMTEVSFMLAVCYAHNKAYDSTDRRWVRFPDLELYMEYLRREIEKINCTLVLDYKECDECGTRGPPVLGNLKKYYYGV